MIDSQDVKKILGGSPLGHQPNSGRQPTIRLDNTVTIRHNKTGYSKHKIIKSGKMFETYEYERPVRYGSSGKKRIPKNQVKSKRSEEYRVRSIIRAGFMLKRLAFLNFSENDKFITLTFNDEQVFDINNLKACLPFYQKFMRKLKSKYKNIKYITVPEFQKRGAVHYHILCDIPYIQKSELQMLWEHGFSKPLAVKNSLHLAFYLTKYLRKRFDDPRKQGHRLYYSSRGLRRPTTLYGPYAEAITNKLKTDHSNAVQYKNSYKTEHNGVIKFTQFVKET